MGAVNTHFKPNDVAQVERRENQLEVSRKSVLNAIKTYNTESLRSELESLNQEDIYTILKEKNESGYTPVCVAIMDGLEDIVQCIADKITEEELYHLMMIQNNWGNIGLHLAAARGHSVTLKFAVAALSQNSLYELLQMRNKAGNTPIHSAASSNSCDIISCMLDSLTPVQKLHLLNVTNEDHQTPLGRAAANDKYKSVEQLKQIFQEANRAMDPEGLQEGVRCELLKDQSDVLAEDNVLRKSSSLHSSQGNYILDDHEISAKLVGSMGSLRPQPGAGANLIGRQSGSLVKPEPEKISLTTDGKKTPLSCEELYFEQGDEISDKLISIRDSFELQLGAGDNVADRINELEVNFKKQQELLDLLLRERSEMQKKLTQTEEILASTQATVADLEKQLKPRSTVAGRREGTLPHCSPVVVGKPDLWTKEPESTGNSGHSHEYFLLSTNSSKQSAKQKCTETEIGEAELSSELTQACPPVDDLDSNNANANYY